MTFCSLGIVKTDVVFLRQNVKTVSKLFRMRVRAKTLDGILIVYTEGCIRNMPTWKSCQQKWNETLENRFSVHVNVIYDIQT